MGTAKAYRFAKQVSRNDYPCIVVVNNMHDKEMLKTMFNTLKYDKARIVTRDRVFDIKDNEESK
jgi:KaiC/GvpD/RAD55 family RecA-like ATPase